MASIARSVYGEPGSRCLGLDARCGGVFGISAFVPGSLDGGQAAQREPDGEDTCLTSVVVMASTGSNRGVEASTGTPTAAAPP